MLCAPSHHITTHTHNAPHQIPAQTAPMMAMAMALALALGKPFALTSRPSDGVGCGVLFLFYLCLCFGSELTARVCERMYVRDTPIAHVRAKRSDTTHTDPKLFSALTNDVRKSIHIRIRRPAWPGRVRL
jgi:hypothetical protein